jgi:type IV pilus assembly protein PilC
MAAKQNREEDSAPRKGSLKDEIIQKIRQQEERERGTESGAPTAAPTVHPSERRFRLFGPNMRQMSMYCRQLATLVDVGIPLLKSLQILGERGASPKLRRVSQDLARRVEEGQPLSTAMTSHPKFFSNVFVGVVRTGEAGGILEDSLRRLADLLERRSEIRRKIIGALTYPCIAFLLACTVVTIIMVFAIPKLAGAYPKPEDLPKVTQALIGISHFVAKYIFVIIGVLVAVIVGFWFIMQTRGGQLVFHRIGLGLPLIGSLARKINVTRFARTLGSLTSAGIPLLDALSVAAETADSALVEKTLLKVRATVERGGKMEEPMRSEPIFDPMVVDMVMVGDEAGALDTMLLKIADSYDTEVDTTLRSLTAILEPLLIIFLGLVVGFIALAIFLPYFNLVNNPALMVE